MLNPNLRDTAERVARDPWRKLGWNDRLVGILRCCLSAGVTPVRFAWGVLAARRVAGADAKLDGEVKAMWRSQGAAETEIERVLHTLAQVRDPFQSWYEGGCPELPAELTTPDRGSA